MALLSTAASVEVIADWAPITSLLSRLTSAPVRVRVKNAIGIRCTCVEHGAAQVDDQPLADARGEPARDQPDHGLQHGQRRRCRRPARARWPTATDTLAARHDRVHHPTGEHRGEHPDRRRDHGEQQERQQPAAVGPGEPPDPRDRALLHRRRCVGAARHRAQHPPGRSTAASLTYTVAAALSASAATRDRTASVDRHRTGAAASDALERRRPESPGVSARGERAAADLGGALGGQRGARVPAVGHRGEQPRASRWPPRPAPRAAPRPARRPRHPARRPARRAARGRIATASCGARPGARSGRSRRRGRTRPRAPAGRCRRGRARCPARLGHAELHVVGDHPQVAGQRELEPAADGMALHGGDRDPVRVPQPAKPAWKPAMVASASASDSSPMPTMPGRPSTSRAVKKCLSSPAENARPRPRTTTTRTSSDSDSPIDAQRLPGGRRLRVQHLGTGERDRRPRAVDVERESASLQETGRHRRCGHAGRLSRRRSGYFFLVRVAPPRPRSVTPVSLSTRCTKP